MSSLSALMLSLVISGPNDTKAQPGVVVIEYCELMAIRQAQLPARLPGVLEKFEVEEGRMVTKEQVLARIDDRETQLRREVALREYEASAEQSRENIEALAAVAAKAVADAEYEDSKYANSISPNSLSPTEVRRNKLTADRAGLQVQVAEMEFRVAGINALAQRAKVDVLDHEVASRRVIAPFGGLVVERYRQEGEWVQAGEAVLRLVQMDRLYVQGMIPADKYAPHEIEGRSVKVVVNLPGGRFHEIKAVITYVGQIVEGSKDYRVRAEIDNTPVVSRDDRTYWLLSPGMSAHMVLNVSDLGRR
jgi:multidrug resistance efflux pump